MISHSASFVRRDNGNLVPGKKRNVEEWRGVWLSSGRNLLLDGFRLGFKDTSGDSFRMFDGVDIGIKGGLVEERSTEGEGGKN